MVHVSELDRELERGLPCNCVCKDCGRALQAHLGSKKAWHFQHQAKDVNCNPQPMTLLHAFVRDELAKRTQLVIPAKKVPVEFEEIGQSWTANIHVPEETWNIVVAETERRFEMVQPDVYFELDTQAKIALEVRYTHAVDESKVGKLHRVVSMCVEFDVSDLPAAGIGKRELDILLEDPERWKWLINGRIRFETGILQEELRWTNSSWQLQAKPSALPKVAAKATFKLKKAESRLIWAKAQLARLKTEAVSSEQSKNWLGAQDKIDRVAIACAALGLRPSALPDFFSQTLEGKNAGAFGHHPYSWQVILFMKFGIGHSQFSAQTAGAWADLAMPDRTSSRSGSKSLNGFTRTAAVIQIYFLNLEAQGLLYSDKTNPLERRNFVPRFSAASELRAFLNKE
jgi:hypothetical protein